MWLLHKNTCLIISYNIVKIPQKAMIKVLCSLLIDPGINVYGQALHYFSKCILVNSIFYNKAASYVCFKRQTFISHSYGTGNLRSVFQSGSSQVLFLIFPVSLSMWERLTWPFFQACEWRKRC